MKASTRKQSELERLGKGGAGGLLLTGGVAGGLHGLSSQALGDLLLGQPEDHGLLNEAARGATGGAVSGAVNNFYRTGKKPYGQTVMKFLMKKHGLNKAGAAAALLTGGALTGAAAGGILGGLTGTSNSEYNW